MNKDYTEINAKTWDSWAQDGCCWSVPVTHEVYAQAMSGVWDVILTPCKTVPKAWFAPFIKENRLDGIRLLGLASGGGQQMPLFAALGAICTVLDYSDRQLEHERIVAAREDYTIDIVKADMTKRLPFADATFDVIFHPVSNCYIEDVCHVWRECFRVLKNGGILLAGMDNGFNFLVDDFTVRPLVITNKLPFNPLKMPDEQFRRMAENKEGIQFSHTLEEQIGGQLKAGFILTDVYEDFDNEPDAIADGIPAYWASRAVKPAEQQGDGKKRVLSFATGDQKAMPETCIRARAFIYRNARPLDLARWQHHFENGSKEAVLTALAAYQNEDGGFGHALEPDAWNPNSTPIQTWSAMEILREIDFTDRMHPMIKGILCYLASGQDFTGQYWLNAVRSNNDYPHAPWWHTDSDSTCHHTYNPTACLAGFIIRFADQDSQLYRLGCRIAEEAIAALQCDSSHDMHTTLCYIRLLQYCEEAGVSHLFSLPALKEKLKLRVNASITRNTAAWDTGYVCRPSQYFKTKGSLFYPENSEIANYECEHIIKSQLEDGSWNIPWHWEAYPEAWSISKNWWKANGALHNMLYLQGMGILAGGSEP